MTRRPASLARIVGLFGAIMVGVIARPATAGDLTVFAGDIPPYSYSKAGQPTGVVYTILNKMAERAGILLDIRFVPWQRAQQNAKASPNAGVIPLSRNAEREHHYKWVGPIVTDRQVLVMLRSQLPVPATLKDVVSWRIGTLIGSPDEVILRRSGVSMVEPVAHEAMNASKLAAKRIDAWVASPLAAAYLLTSLGLDPQMIDYGPELRANDLYLGLSLTTPDTVVEALQSALDAVIADGTAKTLAQGSGY